MPRLRYLDEAMARRLIEVAGELFEDSPAFTLRAPEGEGLLASALDVPRQPNYRTLPQKAGALQYRLSMNHPFFDGNKRFAVAAMETFIALNRAALATTDEQLVWISLAVARRELCKQALIRWVERKTARLDWSASKGNAWMASLSPQDDADVFAAIKSFSSDDPPLSLRIHDVLPGIAARRSAERHSAR